MAVRLLCSSFCLVVVTGSPASADEKKPDPRENIDTLIPHGIQLMEAKKYAEFLEAFVPPEPLKRMKESGMFDEIAKRFGEGRRGNQLLAALKEVKGTEPTYNEGKTEATFKLKQPQGNKKTLDFKKSEKFWVLGN